MLPVFLEGVKKQFNFYKSLGEKTIMRIDEEKLSWQYNHESNSIAIIVNHLYGNMMSRWTNFLTEDGEKDWRHRTHTPIKNKQPLQCASASPPSLVH